MDNLLQRIELAKQESGELEALVKDYLPYIKGEAAKLPLDCIEYEDRLSLAMLVFVNCIKQYQPGRGGFISFCSICIRNRLIDEAKKQAQSRGNAIVFSGLEGENANVEVDAYASIQEYNRQDEQRALAEEIEQLSKNLSEFEINFDDLGNICPKQKRSRGQCLQLAQAILADEEMRMNLFANRRVSQGRLAAQFGISEKTVEKHRRYIVAVAVILAGDYPGIASFIQ